MNENSKVVTGSHAVQADPATTHCAEKDGLEEILRVYEFHGVNNWKEFGSIQRIHFYPPKKWPLFLIKTNCFIFSSFSKKKMM